METTTLPETTLPETIYYLAYCSHLGSGWCVTAAATDPSQLPPALPGADDITKRWEVQLEVRLPRRVRTLAARGGQFGFSRDGQARVWFGDKPWEKQLPREDEIYIEALSYVLDPDQQRKVRSLLRLPQ